MCYAGVPNSGSTTAPTPEAVQGFFKYQDTATRQVREVSLFNLARAANQTLPASIRQFPTTPDPLVQSALNQYLRLATPQTGSLVDRITTNNDYNRNNSVEGLCADVQLRQQPVPRELAPVEFRRAVHASDQLPAIHRLGGLPGHQLCHFKPGTLTGAVPQFIPAQRGQHFYGIFWRNVAPSLGFAWVVPKTDLPVLSWLTGEGGGAVIRSGYSIATIREGMNIPISLWGSNQGRTVTCYGRGSASFGGGASAAAGHSRRVAVKWKGMFTWICPKCGAEVPPSYSECPQCAGQGAAPPPLEEATARSAPPPAAPAPAPQPARPGLPGWALALLFALAFAVVLGGSYFAYQKLRSPAAPRPAAPALEPPSLPSPEAVQAHPMVRHLEITGLRLTEDLKQKAFVQFVVVNHSTAEIGDLAANVSLKAISAKSEQKPVGTFSFKIPLLAASESKDLKVPLDTKLRVYELPDWQFLRVDLRITSP